MRVPGGMTSCFSSIMDGTVREKARKPYLARRGLKFNIPFDARSPSYDDTGTAAHKNIPVMWEFSFWREFLDTLAQNRRAQRSPRHLVFHIGTEPPHLNPLIQEDYWLHRITVGL